MHAVPMKTNKKQKENKHTCLRKHLSREGNTNLLLKLSRSAWLHTLRTETGSKGMFRKKTSKTSGRMICITSPNSSKSENKLENRVLLSFVFHAPLAPPFSARCWNSCSLFWVCLRKAILLLRKFCLLCDTIDDNGVSTQRHHDEDNRAK